MPKKKRERNNLKSNLQENSNRMDDTGHVILSWYTCIGPVFKKQTIGEKGNLIKLTFKLENLYRHKLATNRHMTYLCAHLIIYYI